MQLPSSQKKFDREVWHVKFAPLLNHWEHLVEKHPILHDMRAFTEINQELDNPIASFIAMETEVAGAIKTEISFCLDSLKKVLNGTALLTPRIQTNASFLLTGKVPSSWAKMWDGPAKPAAWLSAYAHKATATQSWQNKVRTSSLLEEELDLNNIFRPLTFLNALRQFTARQMKYPLDGLNLNSSWSKGDIDSPSIVTLKGLLLQGASLQGMRLIEATTHTPEIILMPPVALGFSLVSESCMHAGLKIPVYRDVTREEFLVHITLPISEAADVWILAGIAIFLSDTC